MQWAFLPGLRRRCHGLAGFVGDAGTSNEGQAKLFQLWKSFDYAASCRHGRTSSGTRRHHAAPALWAMTSSTGRCGGFAVISRFRAMRHTVVSYLGMPSLPSQKKHYLPTDVARARHQAAAWTRMLMQAPQSPHAFIRRSSTSYEAPFIV